MNIFCDSKISVVCVLILLLPQIANSTLFTHVWTSDHRILGFMARVCNLQIFSEFTNPETELRMQHDKTELRTKGLCRRLPAVNAGTSLSLLDFEPSTLPDDNKVISGVD